jgi:site-specific DNA recombinase
VAGNRSGGNSYSRRALYDILQNRLYWGEIHHRGMNHPAEHTAIVPRELWDRVQTQLRSDNQGRRNGLKANSTRLLTGLLQDAKGNRFTPCHTSKNDRRYRYYVCHAAPDERTSSNRPVRLPAHDVERQVILRLQSFLKSGREVMDHLTTPEETPGRAQSILALAAKQFDQLQSGGPGVVRSLVRTVVRSVVVHPDRIEIAVSKRELSVVLSGTLFSSEAPVCQRQERGPGELIRLAVEASFRRCGAEMRLIIPPDGTGQDTGSNPVASLVKALARARQWHEWILDGEVSGPRSIANKLGLDERYVSCVLDCAFLAPDIVEATLDGRQPPELTFRKLTHRLSPTWTEQRNQFGFIPLRRGG